MPATRWNELIQHLRRTVLPGRRTDLSDAQLLDFFINDADDAALATLVCRHGPMVWRVCTRMLWNHHDAEDAFQATFLVLVRKAQSIASKELLANWLYGVAFQTALKARAAAAKRMARERQVEVLPEPAATKKSLGHELQLWLDDELSRLPVRYRAVLVLCDLEGKTRTEAARQLRVPEGTVAGWIARARVMLARRLTQHGVILSGGALAMVLAENAAAAALPAAVATSTIKAAALLAMGQRALISSEVVALTEGVVRRMFLDKVKCTLWLIVAGMALGSIGTSYGPSTSSPALAQPRKDHVQVAGPPEKSQVAIVLGPKAFRDGDLIEIIEVQATSAKLEQGDSISVRGRLRLASHDKAQLGLYLTQTTGDGGAETERTQWTDVKRGRGDFELKITIAQRGFLHLTFYDASGRPFGGVYFGTREQMKRIEDWSVEYYLAN